MLTDYYCDLGEIVFPQSVCRGCGRIGSGIKPFRLCDCSAEVTNVNETVLLTHFAAAIASAKAALASLTGPAFRAQATLNGYRDQNATGKPYDSSSRITIIVSEVW